MAREQSAEAPPRRVRWVRVAALAVVIAVIGVIGIAVLPNALKAHANSVPCSRFEAAYNRYVAVIDRVRASGNRTVLATATAELPTTMGTARAGATGSVRVAIDQMLEAASTLSASPTSTGATVAFFSAATGVAHACADDGSDVRLTRLK